MEFSYQSPFPAFIEIQTLSICNARCRVCPMEWTADQLPQGRMDDALLDRLLSEISEHNEHVRGVEPYLNNEPLLDRRLISVLRRIRRETSAWIELSTNASLLRPAISAALLDEALVDDLRFSVFGAERTTHEKVMRGLKWDIVRANILNYAEGWNRLGRPHKARVVFVYNPELHSETEELRVRELWAPTGLSITVWRQLDRLGSTAIRINTPLVSGRGLTVLNCKAGYLRDRVVVMYNGDVLQCCQDWSRTEIIGNLKDATLMQIWQSEERLQRARSIYCGVTTAGQSPCLKCEMATVV